MAWLGLKWDSPPRRQSEHLADYAAALELLRARELVYRCFKTRREVLEDIGRAPHGPQSAYVGAPLPAREETRRLAAGEPFAWRLSLLAARAALGPAFAALGFTELGRGPGGEAGRQLARPKRAGDVILARKDLGVAYHLAVVVDDAIQNITHVVRGEDLFEATHVQRLLQALLGLPTPLYRHHRLLVGPDGRRYAKRDKAETLAEIRRRGVSPEALRAELGFEA